MELRGYVHVDSTSYLHNYTAVLSIFIHVFKWESTISHLTNLKHLIVFCFLSIISVFRVY